MKITVHMSELSQLTELNNLSNSETPNSATLYCLASTESFSSIIIAANGNDFGNNSLFMEL